MEKLVAMIKGFSGRLALGAWIGVIVGVLIEGGSLIVGMIGGFVLGAIAMTIHEMISPTKKPEPEKPVEVPTKLKKR